MTHNIDGLASEIIDALCNYKGFDNWWYNIEDEDAENIVEKIEETIAEFLDAQSQ